MTIYQTFKLPIWEKLSDCKKRKKLLFLANKVIVLYIFFCFHGKGRSERKQEYFLSIIGDILSKHTDCSWKLIARVENCVGEFRRNFLASKLRRKSFFYAAIFIREETRWKEEECRGQSEGHITRSWFHCTRNLNMDHCKCRQTRNRSFVSIERLIYSTVWV